ncbi:MAG: hypothetical protein CL609_18110 [Anaerolineaceae bacterium]|nr:hypothetical protein [Anaerolineaceae bacterium]
MKFKDASPEKINRKKTLSWFWSRWYVQAIMYVMIFVAGAVVYRSGIVQPFTSQIKAVLQGRVSVLSIPQGLSEPINDAVENLTDEIRLYLDNDLPTIYIDIGFEEYQELLEKRNEALDLGILVSADDDFVPASIRFQDGQPLDVEMRLKGDWTDHLLGDKWSFRIKIKEDGAVFGAKEFNIQTPETRNYIWEWAFHQNLISEGVLTTRYDFTNVVLNGKLLGIYGVEDAFTAEMMESQERRQGVLLRFDEDILWDTRADFWEIGTTNDSSILQSNTYESSIISIFKASKIAENPVLSAEAETASNLLAAFQRGERSASEVFDVELMGRFFALSDLWAGCHGLYWHNYRFYYNPVTTLLEPVAYDNEPFWTCPTENSIIGKMVESGLFDDPEIRAAYVHEVERIANKNYIDQVRLDMEQEIEIYQNALKLEYGEQDLGVSWDKLVNRAEILMQELHPAHPVRANYQIVNRNGQSSLVLDITNMMLLPAELVSVKVGDQEIRLNTGNWDIPMVIDPEGWVYTPTQFELPIEYIENTTTPEIEVSVVVRLKGSSELMRVATIGSNNPTAQKIGPLPQIPSVDEVLKSYPFLRLQNPQGKLFIVESGNWLVSGDLVLPYGYDLIISPGASLRFEQGAVMLVNGSVQIKGTSNSPVVITSQDPALGWGGMVVLNANNDSTWTYAIVENTTGIEREGWILTGGITFYRSNITLDHVFIGNNQTEDAINVIHSEFHFLNSEFANTFADAFDSDFSAGEIVNCDFHDIAGDAVDVSGTKASVENTRLVSIVDKAISVGEVSNILVKNVSIDQVGIGIASKDRSTVVVEGSEINNASFAALAAYIKKPVYGPASIEAADIQLNNNKQNAIAQTDNVILLWDELVETVSMDVDLLYDQQILGN